MLHDTLSNRTARLAIIGLGYVGLPLAVTAAERGFDVTGFDIDPGKIDRLEAGQSYIGAVTDADLAALKATGRFGWTTDFSRLGQMDAIVICVPTPLGPGQTPDLSFVEATARDIAAHVTADTLVVLESTTYPGTTAEVLAPLLETSGLTLGTDLYLGFSPEREDPGNTQHTTRSIPKVVAGTDARSGDLTEALYRGIVDTVVRVSDTQTAEAVKITENIFRAVNIALVNELKLVYDAMDIDVWEVIEAAATKPFGYMPFWPGPGLGGHCIPIDPFYLTWRAKQFGMPTRFVELAGEINTAMPQHVIARLREILDQTAGIALSRARVLLVGVAYKKNVSDMRESPAMKLMELMDEGGATVDYIDPHVPEIPPMRAYPGYCARKAADAAALAPGRYDAVLIATDHDAVDYPALLALDCPVIDTRNAIARRGLPQEQVFKV